MLDLSKENSNLIDRTKVMKLINNPKLKKFLGFLLLIGSSKIAAIIGKKVISDKIGKLLIIL